MKLYSAFFAVLWLSQTAAPAQDTVSMTGQSIQGTWNIQVTDPGGNLQLFAVGTYAADGSFTAVSVNPSQSTHKGVWLRTGDRKFVTTLIYFTHDDKGVFTGTTKVRLWLALAQDLKSYDSLGDGVVLDASGNEIQKIARIVGHAVRMDAELPAVPAPE
ncbi:MAG: hypothetical protein M3Z09_09325 [Acidobacteriota bacterium]|nr:hypothetical protein [Acidobacteriota bacterium]